MCASELGGYPGAGVGRIALPPNMVDGALAVGPGRTLEDPRALLAVRASQRTGEVPMRGVLRCPLRD
ncbi:hypothetical protein NDU88_001676 [Pleurodeles waltl]|uniref:Uncharacterized protein n=1 Tax=Pleurodeles waltl TaxID=8319 RepID=A0AAV7TIE0_PLEWA|nr:hypothetical protein NDU88_001676 [Pleurodeles waltl]